MNGYSEVHVFTIMQSKIRKTAADCVEKVVDIDHQNPIRCHELARAVREVIVFKRLIEPENCHVQDGAYGAMEHSWLWLGPLPTDDQMRGWLEAAKHREVSTPNDGRLSATGYPFPVILDVYCPGRTPMVQLVDVGFGTPHGSCYRTPNGWGMNRTDIRQYKVNKIYHQMMG